MDPEGLEVPNSLYSLGISAVIDNYQCFKNEIRILPDNLMFDLYYKVRLFVLIIGASNQNSVQNTWQQVGSWKLFFTFMLTLNFSSY
jgi:hypothetical protein